MSRLLELTPRGLYCTRAGAYIDPWRPVERALITHAHGDHARWGSNSYLVAQRAGGVLRLRLGPDAVIETLPFGETVTLSDVRVSFHPAGHILGSAQIRFEADGEVAVVSGDYKTVPDPTCDAFEPIRCHTFVTESTFGLPIYHWRPESEIFSDIHRWWEANIAEERTSIVLAYALGKAQRVLAGLDCSLGPIALHGSVARLNSAYLAEKIPLAPCEMLSPENVASVAGKGLVVAPPSVLNTPWLRKLAPYSLSFVSGWMQIRGQRRRYGVDRGFALSDHADWEGLQSAIKETGAEEIWVTHGYTHQLAQWLRESGLNARELKTEFSDTDEVSTEEV